MRGPGPWELTDELIDRVLKSIEKTDPAKAKELANLRKSDPERFGQELRERGRDELAKIFREQMDAGRRKWQAEYLDWLEKNYPEEAKELNKYKDRGPEDYMRRFELSMRKYGEIFRASRDNPELAVVLKEDFELKEKRDALLKKIRAAKEEDEKKNLVLQLKEVTRSRYDLIVRQKEITYEQLLKRLEELKQQVNKSKDEITKWKDPKFKDENVNNHVEYLMKGLPRFRWD
jgi:predicted Rossmann fold nucleotide-binding protein DprA/Smf involved in DNA uptake